MGTANKKATAVDGTTINYTVMTCNAPGCTNVATADVQHTGNWLTVFEYWSGDTGYGMFETNYCSRAHLAQMPPMAPTPKKP